MSLMTTEDVVINAIDEGLLACEEEFSQELQRFNADLVNAFDNGADNYLQELDDANNRVGLELDMEHVRERLNSCRKIFIKRINDAVQEALGRAEVGFEELLEPIADEMSSRIEDYSQAVNL